MSLPDPEMREFTDSQLRTMVRKTKHIMETPQLRQMRARILKELAVRKLLRADGQRVLAGARFS